MQTRSAVALVALLLISASAVACGGGGDDLQPMQQQRAGDLVVSILGPRGQFEQGDNVVAVEVRRASDNQLTDAGSIQITSQMPMPGMPNMVAPVSVSPSGESGRYEGEVNYEMKGTWDTVVTLGSGQKASFKLQVR